MARKRGGSLVGGVILVALGLYFLLDRFGIDMPGLGELWPIFPTLAGLGLVWGYLLNREGDAGALVPGCAGFLVGVFFFGITLGPLEWDDLSLWWPVFPMIGGVAFLTLFAFSRERDPGVLVPGLGGLLVGLFFLLFTVGPLSWGEMGRLWPAFPLIGGLTFFGVWLARRRDHGLLAVSGCAVLVGVVGFLFTFGTHAADWVAEWWPIVLLLTGLAIVVRSFVGRPE